MIFFKIPFFKPSVEHLQEAYKKLIHDAYLLKQQNNWDAAKQKTREAEAVLKEMMSQLQKKYNNNLKPATKKN